jgi:hypothetical protein
MRHRVTLDTWLSKEDGGWHAVAISGLPYGVYISAGPVSTQDAAIDQVIYRIHDRHLRIDKLVVYTNGQEAAS